MGDLEVKVVGMLQSDSAEYPILNQIVLIVSLAGEIARLQQLSNGVKTHLPSVKGKRNC